MGFSICIFRSRDMSYSLLIIFSRPFHIGWVSRGKKSRKYVDAEGKSERKSLMMRFNKTEYEFAYEKWSDVSWVYAKYWITLDGGALLKIINVRLTKKIYWTLNDVKIVKSSKLDVNAINQLKNFSHEIFLSSLFLGLRENYFKNCFT